MENEESCINLSTVLSPEPALKTAPFINKGRIQCRICFTGTLERNIKRVGIQKKKGYYQCSRERFRVAKI